MNLDSLGQVDIPIPERETYVPAWGTRHSSESIQVTQNGEPCGFSVGDVLPERRWAIEPSGELKGQLEFERDYLKWITNVCTPDRRVIPLASVNKNYAPALEHIPNVYDFVAVKYDDNEKLVPIDYDATKAAPKVQRKLYDHEGRPMSAKEAAKASARRSSDRESLAQMKLLQTLHADGKLSADDLASAVTALLAGDSTDAESEIASPPEGFDRVESDEEWIAAAPKRKTIVAPCGKEFPKQGSLTMHMRFCGDCKAQGEDGAA